MRKRTLGMGIALAALASLSLAVPAAAGTTGAPGAAKEGLAGPAVGAAAANPGVLPPQSRPMGASYGQWGARWWQWAFQTPASINLLLSDPGTMNAPATVDCTAGQSGHVWFLGGTVSPTGMSGTGFEFDVFRTCNPNFPIPTGTFLFFPVINSEFDNLACPTKTTFTAAQLTTAATLAIDGIVPNSMTATIDGKSVSGLVDSNSIFRAASPSFSYTLPADNGASSFFPGCTSPLPPGTMPPTVDGQPGATADGVYLMLAPLSPGVHHIHFGGTVSIPANSPPPLAQLEFTENVNYTITVAPRGHA